MSKNPGDAPSTEGKGSNMNEFSKEGGGECECDDMLDCLKKAGSAPCEEVTDSNDGGGIPKAGKVCEGDKRNGVLFGGLGLL